MKPPVADADRLKPERIDHLERQIAVLEVAREALAQEGDISASLPLADSPGANRSSRRAGSLDADRGLVLQVRQLNEQLDQRGRR